MSNSRGLTSTWFIYMIIPALLYLILQSIVSGYDYVNQYRLISTIDRWLDDPSPPSADEWASMQELALGMLKRQRNADTVNATGRLYDFRSSRMPLNQHQGVADGHKAMAYFQEVSRLRPAWPHGYMNFVVTKARLGEIDDAFKHTLIKLLHIAPWETITLPIILQLSMYTWLELDAGSRNQLLDYFIIAQEYRKGEVRKTLIDRGQMQRYCLLLTINGEKPSFCP